MGPVIVLAFMAAVVLLTYFFGPRTQPKNPNPKRGGEEMNNNRFNQDGIIDVGESFTSSENPFMTTEKSLVAKRDMALEKAAKRARLTWKDRKELRKATSQNLLELTQQTSDDLKEAIVSKFRSDLNFYVTAHNMRNMANLEKLKLAFEEALTEAYAESINCRMNTKMKALLSTVERMRKRAEELKTFSINGNGKHAEAVMESFERLFQNTINEVENISVRMNQPYFMKD